MAKFYEGDLITATKGETVITGRLENSYYGLGLEVKDAGWPTSRLEDNGYEVTVIERAVPTEPGVYECGNYHETAVLHENGTWFYHGDGSLSWKMTDKDVRDFGPWTRLVPED